MPAAAIRGNMNNMFFIVLNNVNWKACACGRNKNTDKEREIQLCTKEEGRERPVLKCAREGENLF